MITDRFACEQNNIVSAVPIHLYINIKHNNILYRKRLRIRKKKKLKIPLLQQRLASYRFNLYKDNFYSDNQ